MRGAHVPTLHEREKHCTATYASCPVLLTRLRKRRPLTDDEYLAVWTGLEGGVLT